MPVKHIATILFFNLLIIMTITYYSVYNELSQMTQNQQALETLSQQQNAMTLNIHRFKSNLLLNTHAAQQTLTKTLIQKIKQSGLQLNILQPNKLSKPRLAKIIQLKITGTFQAFLRFLTVISHPQTLFKSLKIQKQANTTELIITGELRIS